MKQIPAVILIVLSLCVLFLTIVGNHGLLPLLHLQKEVAVLQERTDDLENKIESTNKDIVAAKNNTFELEKRAREELGLSRSGEIVYLVPKVKEEKR